MKFKISFKLIAILLIIAASLIVYANALDNEFVTYDDPIEIYRNPKLLENPHPILYYLSTGSTYRTTIAINYVIWRANPFVYHFTNYLFYLGICIIGFLILMEITNNKFISLSASLLFAVFPLHVNAVSWVSSIEHPIMGLFTMLSFYFFVKFRKSKKRRILFYSFSLISFMIALYDSRPAYAGLPLALILYDILFTKKWKQFKGFFKKSIVYIPYFLFILIYYKFYLFSPIDTPPIYLSPEKIPSYLSLSASVLTGFKVLAMYLIKLIKIYPMKVLYPIYPEFSFWNIWVILSIILVVGLIILMIYLRNKKRLISFGIGWFFIFIIIPVLVVLNSGMPRIMADRYLLLASFGFCIILAALFFELYQMKFGKISRDITRTIVITLLIVLLLFYSTATIMRNNVWTNSETLWVDTIQTYPYWGVARLNLGNYYVETNQTQRAIMQYNLGLDSGFSQVHHNLALIYIALGEYDTAIIYINEGIKINKDPSLFKLLGDAYLGKNDTQNATKYYEIAIELGEDHYLKIPEIKQKLAYIRGGEYKNLSTS